MENIFHKEVDYLKKNKINKKNKLYDEWKKTYSTITDTFVNLN